MVEPHETPAFQHAVEYTIAVTVTVRGGARHGTADRHARRVAERLANAAARSADVVEVVATAGRSEAGQVSGVQPVRFAAANTGTASFAQPSKLDRYLDPDHERALHSLGRANDAYERRRRADRDRRQEVSCRNTYATFPHQHYCACVYCAPARHYDSLEAQRHHPDNPFVERYCLCGQGVAVDGPCCQRHRNAAVVALDGDDILLQRLAEAYEHEHGAVPDRDASREERRRPPDHGLDR